MDTPILSALTQTLSKFHLVIFPSLAVVTESLFTFSVHRSVLSYVHLEDELEGDLQTFKVFDNM